MLTTPILKNFKSSIDATSNIAFEFTSRGGDQIFKNELEIYNAETNELFYTQVVVSFNTRHIVDEWTLNNGVRYKARVRTYNSTGATSNWSDYINFKCSTTPVISLGLEDGATIQNQTYLFTGEYSQAEGEELQSYKFILYDKYKNQLKVSDEFYSNEILYEFTGFDNGETYYIELKIKTVGMMEVSTGLISFYVKYLQPKMSTVLNVENNRDNASVLIELNVIQAFFEVKQGSISYIDNDWINLSSGSIITNKILGFDLSNDVWSINMRFKFIDKEGDILIFKDKSGGEIILSKRADRLFIRYYKNGLLLISKFHDISELLQNNINLFIQKDLNNFITKII